MGDKSGGDHGGDMLEGDDISLGGVTSDLVIWRGDKQGWGKPKVSSLYKYFTPSSKGREVTTTTTITGIVPKSCDVETTKRKKFVRPTLR